MSHKNTKQTHGEREKQIEKNVCVDVCVLHQTHTHTSYTIEHHTDTLIALDSFIENIIMLCQSFSDKFKKNRISNNDDDDDGGWMENKTEKNIYE